MKLMIEVTEEDIRKGQKGYGVTPLPFSNRPSTCPIARAISRETGLDAQVFEKDVRFRRVDYWYAYANLTVRARKFAKRADEKKPLKPIRFQFIVPDVVAELIKNAEG